MLNSEETPPFELKYEDDLNGFITISSNSDYRNAIANATLLNLNKLILHVRIGDEEEFKQSVQRVKEEQEEVPAFIKDLEEEVGANPPGIIDEPEEGPMRVENLDEVVSEDGEEVELPLEMSSPILPPSDQKGDDNSDPNPSLSFLDDIDDDQIAEENPVPIPEPEKELTDSSSSEEELEVIEPEPIVDAEPVFEAEPVIMDEFIQQPEEEYKFLEKIVHQNDLLEEVKIANETYNSPDQIIPTLGPRKVSKPVGSLIFKAGDPPQKHSGIGKFFSSIKNSVASNNYTDEEKDRFTEVEEFELDRSNSDVILARPGSIVYKTWRIKNTWDKAFPEDTRIVSVTKGLFFEAPSRLPGPLTPGSIFEISLKIFIPDDTPPEDHMVQYVVRLFSDKLSCFGEPIVATIQMDKTTYEAAKLESAESGQLSDLLDRVTDLKQEIIYHRSAWMATC